MTFEKLVVQGFKSFADKTTFDFNKRFTAVVGPNGSGKSNVSDAIRWVMGEQSMKLLRAKSATDLIFGGSETLGKLGMASVEMHLDNADGSFPLEFEKVVIARKLFRSGESEYTINGAKVRLQDVIMMLAQAKFGQKSYAVIGQGAITQFLNSTPQERKIFFDEATGVREFQIKRDQAINKLIRTEEHLQQSETLVREIEPHLASLERMVKRLERREKVEAELRDMQVRFFGMQWSEISSELTQLATREDALKKDLAVAEKELAGLQVDSDKIASESSRTERYSELQQQFNLLLEKKSAIIKDEAVLKAKVEVEHERRGQLSLVWLQRKEDELRADVRSYEEQLRGLTAEIAQQRTGLERVQKQIIALNRDLTEEQKASHALQNQIAEEQHSFTIDELKSELQSLYAEQDTFLTALLETQSMEQFKLIQQQAKRIAKRFADLMKELNEDERETVEAMRVELKQKQSLLERFATEKQQLDAQQQQVQIQIATAESRLHIAESQLVKAKQELETVGKQRADEEGQTEETGQQEAYAAQLQDYEAEVANIEKQIASIRTEIDAFNQKEEDKKSRLVSIQADMRSVQRRMNAATSDLNGIEISIARLETRKEDVMHLVERDVPEDLHKAVFGYTPSNDDNRGELEKKMISLTRQLEAIGNVEQETVDEYTAAKERYEFLTTQIADLNSSIVQLEKVIDELDETIHKQFQRNFKKINESFNEYFALLFDGGNAKLSLLTQEESPENAEDTSLEVNADPAAMAVGSDESETPHDIAEEVVREFIGRKKKKQKMIAGIDVVVNPPRKKITNIAALSGGEKSLVAVALLCSIIANNPAPFVVLDEVEAALDEENSEKLSAILKQLASKTQIIIITHNRVTMRVADMLYGVTIGKEGKSHILSVELEDAEEMVEETIEQAKAVAKNAKE